MGSAKRFFRQPWWMVVSVVYFILAGTGLAAVSEFRVNTYTAIDQMTPALAMNDDGNIVIAWQSNLQDGSFFGIYAQRYDRYGNPVGDEFRVNTQTVDPGQPRGGHGCRRELRHCLAKHRPGRGGQLRGLRPAL